MNTFKEANQAKTSLKMNLSNYGWFKGISVGSDNNGASYCVIVSVSHIDNRVRKVIPAVFEGVSVKTEVE